MLKMFAVTMSAAAIVLSAASAYATPVAVGGTSTRGLSSGHHMKMHHMKMHSPSRMKKHSAM